MFSYDPPSSLLATAFTLSANDNKSNAQASETFTLRSSDGAPIGIKGETLAFAKPQFDPSQFQTLRQQQADLKTQIEALEKNSDDLKSFKELEAEITSIPKRVELAEREVQRSQAQLANAQLSGDANQIQQWQANVEGDQAALDNLLNMQAQIPQSQIRLDQLAQTPGVVTYQGMVESKARVDEKIAPILSIGETSSPLFKDADERNIQADLGGDRALLTRSVASYKLDQLLGTQVIAEEKMAVTADNRLMGVSVQVDGAQITGKHEGKDSFLQADYADPRIQKGLTDLETMDYLTGQIDRHHGNIFVDPSSGKVTGIDNDLCFPERDREVMLASDGALNEKAVAGLPRQMSEDTAKKVLSISPEMLTKELSGITNPDGSGGLSPDEIQGAVQRLENLQAAIKDPSSGLQVVKEFNQDTYNAAVLRQKEVYVKMNSEAVVNPDQPDFQDVDNARSLIGVHKASYVGAAVMQGRSYELKEGMVIDDIEVGLRAPDTAGIKATAVPEYAAFKAEEQKAKQTLSQNPEFIEDLGTRREAIQVKEQMAAVQAKLDGYQKRLDKLESPGMAERAQAVLTHGGVDKSREFFRDKQMAALQEMKALEQKMDSLTDKAVAPLRTDLYMAAQDKLAAQAPAASVTTTSNPKLDQMRDIATQHGLDLKMLELEGPNGEAQTPNAMRQVAANKEINASTWRERGDRAIEKDEPAEAKIAFAKADRDEAFGSAIRSAANMLDTDTAKLSPDDMDKLHQEFSSAADVNQKHNIEEAVQNEQRLALYEQEVETTVTPVLQAQGFDAAEIKAFSQAATRLGIESESAALKNNAEYAKMFAGDLKRGLETSDFQYSSVNESASKLHDALYKAYETKAHVHDDGDIEIKRGHASFQEKRANIILNETAAANQVSLPSLRPQQPAAQFAPEGSRSPSTGDSLKRSTSSVSLADQVSRLDKPGGDNGKDVRAELRRSKSLNLDSSSGLDPDNSMTNDQKQKNGKVAKLKEMFESASKEPVHSVGSEKPKLSGAGKKL
jgi:predicted kinase